jgi:hypothetical protein
MEHRSKEQKQRVQQMTQHFLDLCLKSFTMTHFGTMIQKSQFPRPVLQGESNAPETKVLTTTDVNDMVNTAVHHTLINQSGLLANTLQSLIKQKMEGTLHAGPNRGPHYFAAPSCK